MLVEFAGDKRTFITFKHITTGKDRRTICTIVRKYDRLDSEPVVLAEGVARCSQTDPFRKEIGRRLAMTRALARFDKPFRTAAWDAYWGRNVFDREEAEFVAAYVPDTELSYEDALAMANALDTEAADALKAQFAEAVSASETGRTHV